MSATITLARHCDIEEWMTLVSIVEDYFPGLEIEEYRKSLIECVEKEEAICAKVRGQIVGILMFSVKRSSLAFLAVHLAFRKRGIAFSMIKTMISAFPSEQDIWVTTYREGDPKGKAARALYLRCGFVPDELVVEMDYPCQKFVLHK